MKKYLLGIVVVVVLFLGFSFLQAKPPVGFDHEKADSLALKMMEAINHDAWQKTAAVEWNFMGSHEHLWDKERHFSRVRWKKYEVIFDINTKKGFAYKEGELLAGEEAKKIIEKAYGLWANDSFWLNPVSKAFDGGTTRSMVKLKKGKTGLMVSYASGGVTPGDSYVWLLDEQNMPTAWKMWVSIIPIGGIRVPWNGWITTETGVKICNLHDTAIIDLKLKDVRTAFDLKELTNGKDPFESLVAP